MGRIARSSKDVIARDCQHAPLLAGDANRLARAPCAPLGVAAAFLARALAGMDDGPWKLGPRSTDAIQKIEAAGKAIGVELRRRVD
jgi:hypothetical protein